MQEAQNDDSDTKTEEARSFLGRMRHSYGVLKIRNFRYLFLSNICIHFAQWCQSIGLGWLVLEITGSAAQMGGIVATQGFSLLISSPFAGVLSDRVHRRTLLMVTTSINAAQALSLATLVATGYGHLWELYVFAIVGGMANAVTQPVRQAFVYDAVGREAVALAVPVNNLAQSGSRVLGPAFAGMVIGFTGGSSSAFYVQGVLALMAILITSRIGVTAQVRSAGGVKESPFKTLTQGLRYVAGNPSLRGQVIVQIIPALLVYPYVQFLAFFAAHLHGGPQTYGLLASGAGYGGVVALFILTTLGEVKHKGRVMFAAVIGYPVSVALFTLSPVVSLAMVFLMINGFCNQIYTAMQNTMFLLGAREDMRGRVMGIYSMIQGLGPIGQLCMGFAIATWGPDRAVLWFEIAAIILLSITCVFSKTVREA